MPLNLDIVSKRMSSQHRFRVNVVRARVCLLYTLRVIDSCDYSLLEAGRCNSSGDDRLIFSLSLHLMISVVASGVFFSFVSPRIVTFYRILQMRYLAIGLICRDYWMNGLIKRMINSLDAKYLTLINGFRWQ